MFLVVSLVLSLLTCSAIESSRNWQRFKNEHGCQIIPREGKTPRRYVCAKPLEEMGCTTDTDCMDKFGGDGGPAPRSNTVRI